MSSVGLSGISGISDNTLNVRYQKALKQINKLIEMNRQLKDSMNEKQDQIDHLHQEIQKLERDIHQLDQENNMMDAKYMQLEQHCRQLNDYVHELETKLQNNDSHDEHFQTRLRQTEQRYNEQLQNEVMKNNQLTREAEMLNQMYQQSIATLEEQNIKIKDLKQQNQQLKSRNFKLTGQLDGQRQQLSMYVKDKNIYELQRKLDKANQTIDKLVKQCNELRNKQIDIQVMDEKKRVEKYIGLGAASDVKQSQAVKNLIAEYRRKYKNLEEQKKQLERKYRHLKRSIPQSHYTHKIKQLEKLTEKQQAEIGTLIETYDHKLHSLAGQNHKLKQSCRSLQLQLIKKSTDLTDKQKQLLNLKNTSQKISFENQSLRKVNHQLSENSSRIKQLSGISKDLSQADSMTMFDKKYSEQYRMSFDNSFKKIPEKNEGSSLISPNSPLYEAKPKERATFDHGDSKKIPFFRGNSSDASSDFKFIQSVNIINGYNVNLGENSSQPSKK